MAVPTITTITPDSGFTTGRNIIDIAGTNFRLPTHPVDPSEIGPAQKTISVTFDGVEAEWAFPLSDTLARVRVPIYAGDPFVDFPVGQEVRLANLDDSEVEIPGENVSVVDGYSYEQTEFAKECFTMRVLREFTKMFQRHVLANSAITAERDYAEDDAALETLRANLPALHIVGPRCLPNRIYGDPRIAEVEDPLDSNAYLRRKAPITQDWEFDIVGWADDAHHLYAMAESYQVMVRDVVDLPVSVDPDDPTRGVALYEIDVPLGAQLQYDTLANLDNLRNFRGTCRIRGVHVDRDPGTIVERGYKVFENDGEPVVEILNV